MVGRNVEFKVDKPAMQGFTFADTAGIDDVGSFL